MRPNRLIFNPIAASIGRATTVMLVAWLGGIAGAGCSDEPQSTDMNQYMETISMSPGEQPPLFVFPDEVKTDDVSLNNFIRDFAQICVAGEYDKYRLRVRRRTKPVSKEDFEKVWHNIGEIRIESISPLPESERTPAPRYAVVAKIRMREPGPESEKLVVMQVLREVGQWVIDVLRQDDRPDAVSPEQAATTLPAATLPVGTQE